MNRPRSRKTVLWPWPQEGPSASKKHMLLLQAVCIFFSTSSLVFYGRVDFNSGWCRVWQSHLARCCFVWSLGTNHNGPWARVMPHRGSHPWALTSANFARGLHVGIAQNESEPTSFSPRWLAINKWHPVSDYAKTLRSGNELGLGLPVPFEHLAQSFECDALSQSPLTPSWSGESFFDPLSPREIHYRTNETVVEMLCPGNGLLPRPQSKLYAHCLVRSTRPEGERKVSVEPDQDEPLESGKVIALQGPSHRH